MGVGRGAGVLVTVACYYRRLREAFCLSDLGVVTVNVGIDAIE